MIHHSDEPIKVNDSDYISEKLDYDYTYLSNTFSEVKEITMQQYIIIHKIEKVKELLLYFVIGGSIKPLAVVDLGTSGNYVVLAKTAAIFDTNTVVEP